MGKMKSFPAFILPEGNRFDSHWEYWNIFRITYPTPNQTFCPKWDANVNVELGEGLLGSPIFPPARLSHWLKKKSFSKKYQFSIYRYSWFNKSRSFSLNLPPKNLNNQSFVDVKLALYLPG